MPRGDGTVWCACAEARIADDDCDGCSHFDDWDWLDDYEEPPLYKPGALSAMTPEQLNREMARQAGIHDSAVDRCEEINSPTIEAAAARMELVEAELKARGLDPYAWLDLDGAGE